MGLLPVLNLIISTYYPFYILAYHTWNNLEFHDEGQGLPRKTKWATEKKM